MQDILQEVARLFPTMRPAEQQAVLKALQQDRAEERLHEIVGASTTQPGIPRRRTIVDADFTGTIDDFARTLDGPMRGGEFLSEAVAKEGGVGENPFADPDISNALGLDPALIDVQPELVAPIEGTPGFNGAPAPFQRSKLMRIIQGVGGAVQVLGAASGNTGLAFAGAGAANRAGQIRAQRYGDYLDEVDAYRQALGETITVNKQIEIANAKAKNAAVEGNADREITAFKAETDRIEAEATEAAKDAKTRIDRLEADLIERVYKENPGTVIEATLAKMTLPLTDKKEGDAKANALNALAEYRRARADASTQLTPLLKRRAKSLEADNKALREGLTSSFKVMGFGPNIPFEQAESQIRAWAADPASENYEDAKRAMEQIAEILDNSIELVKIRGFDDEGLTPSGDAANPFDAIFDGAGQTGSERDLNGVYDPALGELDAFLGAN